MRRTGTWAVGLFGLATGPRLPEGTRVLRDPEYVKGPAFASAENRKLAADFLDRHLAAKK
jgi:hypothetical protein